MIKSLPTSTRHTSRDLASALKVGKTTILRFLKDTDGVLQRHTNAIKPSLTPENKLARIAFCYDDVDDDVGRFSEMNNIIHINEKWFNQTEINKTMYLVEGEKAPHRTTRHKSHIPRIMFLAVMARPRYDLAARVDWEGWYLGVL